MAHINIEFKARCASPEKVRAYLKGAGADFKGADRQIDTYYAVPQGRLKVREGNIEKFLIFYERPDQEGPKRSDVILHPFAEAAGLKQILERLFGVKVVVDKKREIYFIENVKFHIDNVEGLGNFIEVEAIDKSGELGVEKLQEQCDLYRNELAVTDIDLVECSYSDLLMEKRK